MNITFTRSELCELLEINDNNMKSIIKRNQLEERLNKKGYHLEKQYKDGRNTIYELSLFKADKIKQLEMKYNIRKTDYFRTWCIARLYLKEGLTMNRRQIISECNIQMDDRTAKKFDDILVAEEILVQDGFVYARKNRNNIGTNKYQWEEVTKDYYNNYFAEQDYYKKLASNYNYKLHRQEITQKEHDLIIDTQYENMEYVKGWIVCRYAKYEKTPIAKEYITDMLKAK